MLKRLIVSSFALAISAAPALAETHITGVVEKLTVIPERIEADAFHSRLMVRMLGVCIDTGPNGSYDPPITASFSGEIIIQSGRMDGPFAHNAASFSNAFDLLKTSLLERRMASIMITGECEDAQMTTVELWKSEVSLDTEKANY